MSNETRKAARRTREAAAAALHLFWSLEIEIKLQLSMHKSLYILLQLWNHHLCHIPSRGSVVNVLQLWDYHLTHHPCPGPVAPLVVFPQRYLHQSLLPVEILVSDQNREEDRLRLTVFCSFWFCSPAAFFFNSSSVLLRNIATCRSM